MRKAKAKAGTRAKTSAASAGHTLREDYPWEINYGGHEPRSNSPLYAKSRELMKKIASSTTTGAGGRPWFFGADDPKDKDGWEDHHGGGLWAHDGQGWFFLKNYAGMEWASQFCADPAKVECFRLNAKRLYQDRFLTNTKAEIAKLDPSYPFDEILNTPITTADHVAQWTDSIFNASVPLPKKRHTGVPKAGHGVHHFPTPVFDIELFKHDDFTLWVEDDEKQPAAVVPVHPRGVDKNDPRYKNVYGKVALTYATPGTKLAKRMAAARKNRKVLVGDANHKLAKQAFKNQ